MIVEDRKIVTNALALLEELQASKSPSELYAWAMGESFLIEQTIGDLKFLLKSEIEITKLTNDDDWNGLYIDGELVIEGRPDYVDHFSLEKFLEHIDSGVKIKTVIKSQEWFDEQGGHCPTCLAEVD